MIKTLERIEFQARNLNFFDDIKIFNEKNLDSSFRKRFKLLLRSDVRGFGYWVWKPQILKQLLSSMSDGDTLLYLDAGCHLNPKGLEKLVEYYSKLNNSCFFILATQLEEKYLEKYWTKGDLFDYFHARYDEEIVDTPQIQAGVILIKKTSKSISFLDEWLRVYETSTALVDDSPSISSNFEGFIGNRHDQSIFSILCKRADLVLIPNSDIYRNRDWSEMESYPIWAMRDKIIYRSLIRRIGDHMKSFVKQFYE